MTRPSLPPSWRKALWGGVAALLALPAIAMQFTREVNWGAEDFLAAAFLLVLAGLGLELAARARMSKSGRILASAAVFAATILIWIELAVGIFH